MTKLRLLASTLLVAATLATSGCRLWVNFHEVDPGKYYRSAQLTGEEFEHVFTQLGIKSVINLRGKFSGADWYEAEVAVTHAHGVKLVDIPMSADHLPHKRDLIRLFEAFDSLPRPILLHCLAGVDRTGEASALYMMEYMGRPKEEALEMLSSKYLYLPFFKPAKIYFVRDVYQGKDWALHTYDPCVQKYDHYEQAAFCPEPPEEPNPRE